MDSVSTFEVARQVYIHQCLQVFGFTFLVWDHIITLGAEISYVWARARRRKSAYMFFLHRYFALLGNISVTVFSFMNLDTQSCNAYALYRQILLVATQTVVCGILTLRLYVLYECNKKILALMLGSGCVLAIFACWVLTDQNSTTSPLGSGTLTGCHIGLSRKTAIRVAASWESLFVYDSMLFALTLIKTYRTRRKGTLRINLLSLLLRDGAIYFALMALANLSNLLTFYLAPPYLRGGLSTFATCVSVTMLSRFTLILFESTEEALYSTTVNLETMIFVEDPRPPTSTRYSAELIGLEDVCLENYHKTDTNKG